MKKLNDATKLRLVKKQLKTERTSHEFINRHNQTSFDTAVQAANKNAAAAKEYSENLRIERVGRRAMLESLRAEHARLVHELYVCEQRLAVLRDTECGGNGALAIAAPQVENDKAQILAR